MRMRKVTTVMSLGNEDPMQPCLSDDGVRAQSGVGLDEMAKPRRHDLRCRAIKTIKWCPHTSVHLCKQAL
ncbi:uncharacterized protein Bfra_001223 [Botrytis fragariae]|uniref:Uncharacterized protein n=1 Tax=Botrytis fragariae TaxID=1964551 RepID=A0A8H6B0C8_9HELO|nr:uncharacterized protein Bfra_001223 [Botrytis fragariae]KAF5876868.1 hypothetical protein Bfra_001223 [Botrytis fragariae]